MSLTTYFQLRSSRSLSILEWFFVRNVMRRMCVNQFELSRSVMFLSGNMIVIGNQFYLVNREEATNVQKENI